MVQASPTKTLQLISKGAGMTVGLELWKVAVSEKRNSKTHFVLIDTSPDRRFADDVTTWNSAVGLNTKALKQLKDAVTTKQDTT